MFYQADFEAQQQHDNKAIPPIPRSHKVRSTWEILAEVASIRDFSKQGTAKKSLRDVFLDNARSSGVELI